MPLSLRFLVAFVILFGAAGVAGQAQPLAASPHSDVLLLSPAELRARDTAIRVLASPAAGQGERVSYRAFNGRTYQLTRFRGRHVDILLPDTWTAPGALPLEQIWAFVDRSDLVYQHFLDLTGAPPAGKGRLPVALVPDTCGGGCALRGVKGIEILDSPRLRPYLWQEIAADVPSGILIHEMTHNFDLVSSYIAYTPDPAHAWTSFLSYYYNPYAWEGYLESPVEDLVKEWSETSGRYFRDPKADWRRCVLESRCEDRGITSELAWGGFSFRLALLDGPRAARGFLDFLREYRQSHRPPVTAEAKNDLYLRAWAAGTGRNLSCVADAWRWPLSDALRETLARRYPNPNPDCQDRDGDGFSPLEGDCNDRRPVIRPGAAERLPEVDDDCDGRVDERTWREPAGGDFSEPLRLALPAEIIATGGDTDTDELIFRLESPGSVWIKACPSQDAVLTLFDETGVQREPLYFLGGACAEGRIFLEAGTWQALVNLFGEESGARYSLTLESSPPWPPAPWAATAPPTRQGSGFVLTATSLLPQPPGANAEIRFWVSGQGFVGKVPYVPEARLVWTPPSGLDPEAEGLTYRVQLLVRGVPAQAITPPQSFAAR